MSRNDTQNTVRPEPKGKSGIAMLEVGSADHRGDPLFKFATLLQNSSEQEKEQLARRLHDELGGLLTAAKMDLSWLQTRIDAPALRERLAQLGAALDEAMALKRRMVDELRPSLLDHFGLPTALRSHLESVCSQAGLKCEIAFTADLPPPPRETAIALFRVMEEGLRNIVRHARATAVRVSFQSDARNWRLHLSDDGCGIDYAPQPADTLGLSSMRHRIEALGGKFRLDSDTRGTRLSVELPISTDHS